MDADPHPVVVAAVAKAFNIRAEAHADRLPAGSSVWPPSVANDMPRHRRKTETQSSKINPFTEQVVAQTVHGISYRHRQKGLPREI